MGKSALNVVDQLGYSDWPEALHKVGESVDRSHPYALEIRHLLEDAREEHVLGVYDVDGVPAVCLVEGTVGEDGDLHSELRKQLWNQGLVSLLLVIDGDGFQPWPVVPNLEGGEMVSTSGIDRDCPYSAFGIRSGALRSSHPEWFDPELRIDKFLLASLEEAVNQLADANGFGFERLDAQHLLAQVLFVSYLDDRGLISDAFLSKHGVSDFRSLLTEGDGQGLDRLLNALKDRFNGDFLEAKDKRAQWSAFPSGVFDLLSRFLARDDLVTAQQDFWGYDFRYIPVELLSGIYETFLSKRKKKDAAYYTPRHLANLVVDEAFRDIVRPQDEVVWDGACGSGILLTTAFRRMLGAAEADTGRKLDFSERVVLLRSSIKGGDINASACKVTAFSLYLCLFEDLSEPGAGDSLKLPRLIGRNIFGPNDHGDVFSTPHPLQQSDAVKPTVVISNPPWKEPDGVDKHNFDHWAESVGWKIPLRQIATAYAVRVCELSTAGARVCLVLPGGSFLRQQHHKFVTRWLRHVTLRRLINFSDMRHLLFPGAKHPCVVVSADNMPPPTERPHLFDYLTPKADPALHYGRLTVYSSDRRDVLQSQARENDSTLRGLYWASSFELSEIARLSLKGTLRTMNRSGEVMVGTGFHPTDRAKRPIKPGPLKQQLFIDAKALPRFGPVLAESSIRDWPKKYVTVADRGRPELFEGPRVVVPNGMTPDHRIRAFFVDSPASINISLTALRFIDANPAYARFLAAYLSSDLAAYLALVRAPSAVMERTQIKMGEIMDLPFHLPSQASNPTDAMDCLKQVSKFVEDHEAGFLSQAPNQLPEEIEHLIQRYFGISETMARIVGETSRHILSNLQPTTLNALPSPLQQPPKDKELSTYAHTIVDELTRTRDNLGGKGYFDATIRQWDASVGGLGIVAVQVRKSAPNHTAQVSNEAAERVIDTLSQMGLLEGVLSGGVSLVGDVLIRDENTLYFAKPLVRRLWLSSCAIEDAGRIIRRVQREQVL